MAYSKCYIKVDLIIWSLNFLIRNMVDGEHLLQYLTYGMLSVIGIISIISITITSESEALS